MLHKMGDEQWAAMLDVHNTAPFRMICAAAPHMRDPAKQERGQELAPTSRRIFDEVEFFCLLHPYLPTSATGKYSFNPCV